jgi:hypothetical protein
MTLSFMTGGALGLIRSGFRLRYNLRSNYFADWSTSTFLWPQLLAQMRMQCLIPSTMIHNEEFHRSKDRVDFEGDEDEDTKEECA